ncbi:MAG: hypothetical protein M1816_003720 [Peltula sp. TS41687]|nr:MAG: hypothetical protein M1816_003720 [Peltula sp. TS41687]
MSSLHVNTDSNGRLLETGAYSDLILWCGARKFHVHRAIICPKSSLFAKACDGNFKEATSRTINLVEDDPDTVVRMLSYLYISEYDDLNSNLALGLEHPVSLSSKAPRNTLSDFSANQVWLSSYNNPDENEVRPDLVNIALHYAMADRYDIVGLKGVVIQRFQTRASSYIAWPPRNLREVAKAVYETTPDSDRGLGDALVETCYAERMPWWSVNMSATYKPTAVEFDVFY